MGIKGINRKYNIDFEECRRGAMQVKQSWVLTVKNIYDYYKYLNPETKLLYENFCGMYNKYVKEQEGIVETAAVKRKSQNIEVRKSQNIKPELYSKQWLKQQMNEKPDKNTRPEILEFLKTME